MQIIYTHVHVYLYMSMFVQGNVYKEGSRGKKIEKKEGRKEERKEGTYLNFPMRVARFFEMARFFCLSTVSSILTTGTLELVLQHTGFLREKTLCRD